MSKEQKKILEVIKIDTYYGLSHILNKVSLYINQGQVVCLLGRNGSGKTTTIRSIMGLTSPKKGSIRFLGEEITRKPSYMIARKGIRVAFNEKRVFGNLTVRENLEIGRIDTIDTSYEGTIWNYDKIYGLFPVLKKYESRHANSLSGGEQQMLCVANALIGNPKLLLLDEPSIGLAPLIIKSIKDYITELKHEGLSILLTEQNIKFAQELGDFAYIIDNGSIKHFDKCSELFKNEEIVSKYLAV